MDPALKDAVITFLRALFAAMVGAAIVYITGLDLAAITNVEVLAKGLAIAVINAVLLFLGAWLRGITTIPVPQPVAGRRTTHDAAGHRLAGAHLTRTRSWADNLPV